MQTSIFVYLSQVTVYCHCNIEQCYCTLQIFLMSRRPNEMYGLGKTKMLVLAYLQGRFNAQAYLG